MIHIIEYAIICPHLYNIIFYVMKGKGLFKSIGLILIGSLISISSLNAQDSTDVAEKEVETPVVGNANWGREYFEGSRSFKNGGPACITCHNVTYDGVIPGGRLAKDLTSVYDRMGDVTIWLENPAFPAMTASYANHPLLNTVNNPERSSLSAFLEHVNAVKDEQKAATGNDLFLVGGVGGLIGILILISLLWMKRKKQMVKKDIFARQNSAWDAKH